jgi:hypothetical protein
MEELLGTQTGLTLTGTNRRAGDIIMHPTNNQILWCATSIGLYKTTNAGANWTVVQTGNFSQGNIRLKPNDPNTVLRSYNKYVFLNQLMAEILLQ